jgi:hypothetical protein
LCCSGGAEADARVEFITLRIKGLSNTADSGLGGFLISIRESQPMTTWYDARLLDPAVPVYASANRSSRVIEELTGSPIVKLGGGANGFFEVQLNDGRLGYVDETVQITQPPALITDQYGTMLQSEPSEKSTVVAMLKKGARVISTEPAIEGDGIQWLHVTSDGRTGYIRGDTKLTDADLTPPAQDAASSAAMQNVIWGFVICAVGVIVTVGSYVIAEHTVGVYVVAWGAIFFGGVQILKGLSQMTAKL